MFEYIENFENELAEFTGAPYVVTTDCCTHAIELCLIYDDIKACRFTAFTYLSVIMTMHKLDISYSLLNEKWEGEYQFHDTRIWDSARRLQPDMYRPGQLQCVSFGYTKPLDIGRGGAILLDDKQAYTDLLKMRYDGRDLNVAPWISQQTFSVGYHYKLNPEECEKGSAQLHEYINANNFDIKNSQYPDCRNITIK